MNEQIAMLEKVASLLTGLTHLVVHGLQQYKFSYVMDLFSHPCPCCGNNEICPHSRYKTLAYGERTIYHCLECDIYFSETFATPIAGMTNPLSRIITILKVKK
ncbi:MAG: hypothetical protein HC770_11580, partial [Pseudanabaena sp. CRU_2_10]|nr:hypothetical protein [Pseudanabaena sp. CRU_2_10]